MFTESNLYVPTPSEAKMMENWEDSLGIFKEESLC